MKYCWTLFLLLIWLTPVKAENIGTPSILVERGPDCFDSYDPSTATHRVEDVSFDSNGVTIVGKLYLPAEPGQFPAALFMHGGGNNLVALMDVPNYFGPRMARCGYAALVYDKRGTGKSGGDFEETDFNDFVRDAGMGAQFLAGHSEIDPEHIGIVGVSQGGRLAPIVAVRYSEIRYAVSVSGPQTSTMETRLFALKNAFSRGGASEEVLGKVMPLWREHLQLVAAKDTEGLSHFDSKIEQAASEMPPNLLPPSSGFIPRNGIYNSMGLDFSNELRQLSVPWFSLYGSEDQVVQVNESVEVLKAEMKKGNHNRFEVRIIPNASHSFLDLGTNQLIGFESLVMDWIVNRLPDFQ